MRDCSTLHITAFFLGSLSAGLSYQEGFVVRLWKFFESFGSDDSPDSRLSSLEKTGLFNSCELQAALVLFCDCCSHLMP